MTNLNDLKESEAYLHLKFVEFLDLLCRVSVQYHIEQEEAGGHTDHDLEDQVHRVMEMLWQRRAKKARS